MKKINKSPPPNPLFDFYNEYPDGTWEDFRNYNAGVDYKSTKNTIFSDQGVICAYCERDLSERYSILQQIEHYHSKSDITNPLINWALDWNNVIGVCAGGANLKHKYPLPMNLSCDAYKAHLEVKNKLPIPCEGYVLNPLDIIATPKLFNFDKSTGELLVDTAGCAHYKPTHNNFTNVADLINNTIIVFNLNCNRLKEERLQVFHQFQRVLKKARTNGDRRIHAKLADRWFTSKWCSYFTTRRTLLGEYAEIKLETINYSG